MAMEWNPYNQYNQYRFEQIGQAVDIHDAVGIRCNNKGINFKEYNTSVVRYIRQHIGLIMQQTGL